MQCKPAETAAAGSEAFWRHRRRRAKEALRKEQEPAIQPIKKEFADLPSFMLAHTLPKSSPILASHTSMVAGKYYGEADTGKYFIFYDEFEQFFRLYAKAVNDGTPQYLSEEAGFLKINNRASEYGTDRSKRFFRFYLDLDPKHRSVDDKFIAVCVGAYKKALQQVLKLEETCANNAPKEHANDSKQQPEPKALQHFVIKNSANPNKVHVHFPAIIVNKKTALYIRKVAMFMPELAHIPEDEKDNLFDANYAGLRMLGSSKLDKKQRPWAQVEGTYFSPKVRRRRHCAPLAVADLFLYSIKSHPDCRPTPKRTKCRASKRRREKRKQQQQKQKVTSLHNLQSCVPS